MTTTKHEFVDDYPFLVYTDDVNTTKGDYLVSDSNVSALTEAPEGTISITENGSGINVAQYAYADVNVSGGGGSTEYNIICYDQVGNVVPSFVYPADSYDEETYKWIPNKSDGALTKATPGTLLVTDNILIRYIDFNDSEDSTEGVGASGTAVIMPANDAYISMELY